MGNREINSQIEEKKIDNKTEKKENNERKNVEKKEKDEKNRKGKEFFLYFIVANYSNSIPNIELIKNKYSKNLKAVRADSLKNDLYGVYTINRLKIIPTLEMKDLTIKFKLLVDEKSNYNAEIQLKEFSHDYFFYDFKYEISNNKENDCYQKINTDYIKLNHHQQFMIYLNYIEDEFNMEMKDSLLKSLILSTKNLLIIKEKIEGKDKLVEYYDFSLYLTVFTHSYETSIFLDLLKEFELKYLDIKYMALDLNRLDIEKIKYVFNKIEKDIEKIFKELENLENNTKYQANLYFIILVFRQFYEKENFQKTLNNAIKNKDTHKRIYRGIIRFPDLFLGARFEKEQISKMIKFCENYKGIKRSLKYITNINDYLDIILENFDIITELRDDMKKNKNKKTDEFYWDISRDLIKETDNIQKICENYEKIMDKQKEKKIDGFIVFGSKLFDKYMKYYHGNNLGNLYNLMNLIKKIIKNLNEKSLLKKKTQNIKKDKKEDDDFLQKYKESEKKLEDIIYQTGMELSEKDLLTSMEILDFLFKEKNYIRIKSKENKDEIKYVTRIFKNLHRNERFKNCFNDLVKKEIGLKENQEKLIIEMFKQENKERKNGEDNIGIIYENIFDRYINYLEQFYFNEENDNFFVTLSSIEEEKKLKALISEKLTKIKNEIIHSYFQELRLEIQNKIGDKHYKNDFNEINIYLGLKIPEIINSLKEIKSFIKEEIENKYIKIENNLRNDKESKMSIINYESQLKNYNEMLYNEILKKSLLYKMYKQNDKNKENELFNLLLQDYYTHFIFENIKNIREMENNIKYINDIQSFLDYLFDITNKDDKDLDPNKNIEGKIIFIECHKREIAIILQMFSSLNLIIKDLNNKIIELNKERIKIFKKDSVASIYNNLIFFAMESILRLFTSNSDIYISLKDNPNDFYKLMNINREILQSALKLGLNLNLFTPETYSLKEIIEIIDVFSKSKKDTNENIKIIIKYFSDEALLISNIKEENGIEIFNHFINFYNFLLGLIGESDLFPKLMSIIFQNEYLKIQNKYFRFKLLEPIISRNDYIDNCYPLLKLILKRIGISILPRNIQDNIKILDNNEDHLIEILNNKKNDFLAQYIIQIFEHLIFDFFDNIDKMDEETDKKDKVCFKNFIDKKERKEKNYKKYMIFEKSLDIFEQCINRISQISSNKNIEINKFSNLSKLYSISFIKVYLTKFIEFCEKYDDIQIKTILDGISKNINKNTNLENVIKIYILKILYNLNNRNLEKLFKYDFILRKEFENINIKSEYFLINYFVPLDENEEKEFKYGIEKYYSIIDETKKKEEKEIVNNCLNDDEIKNIDIFLSITINALFSNLFLKNYFKENTKELKDYKKLGEYLNTNYKNQNITLKKLLNLFYNKNLFLNVIMEKFDEQYKWKDYIGEPYESLLYGFKFCVQYLLKIKDEESKYFYSAIMSDIALEIINETYIPGNNEPKIKKLEALKSLKYCLYNSNIDTGYYSCSCGYLYSITPNYFPTEEHNAKCPDCGKRIGYIKGKLNHEMVLSDCNYMIFKNFEQKQEQISRWNIMDKNIPNVIFEQYKKEVMDSIKNSLKKGIYKDTKSNFLDNNKNIRKMSKISFRLLNFILYNHLFFANCLEFISDEELENYLIEGMNCLEIIQSNWHLLEESLKEKNIYSIQAFLNIIFKDLSNLISNCKIMENEDELIEFEEEVEKIVELTIQKYPKYYEKYKKMNIELNFINQKDIKIILNETYPPLPPLYPENEFPLLKYFIYTEYKINIQKYLEQEEDYFVRYPLLNCYLNYSKEIKYLEYLPSFNEFINLMIEKFSYKLTREDAKNIELNKSEGYDEVKFNNFLKCWENIYKYATKYKCRDDMEPKKLKAEDKLIYFLIDDNELGYGMYIAAAYQNFISWQNGFLQSIIDSDVSNGYLHNYIENIKKKVPIQEAKASQILSIDDCFKNSEYKNFDDLVYTFTKRDNYYKDAINYHQHNKFKIDFSKIEEELAKLILPEKCLFENEDKLNFFVFCGEGFRGSLSDTFVKFYDKYPQVDLIEDELKNMHSSVLKIFENNNNDFKSFFDCMQSLIIYLSNNLVTDKDINSILKNRREHLRLDNNFINFFSDKNFNINQLMNIYIYIEHLSFNDLSKILQTEYKKKIDDNIILTIKKELEIENKNDKIPWKYLATAVRRFISRYLVGDRQTTDVNENSELIYQLERKDLWEEKYGKLDNLEQLISEKMNIFKIKVGQAFSFYEIIGAEDKNSIIIDKENQDKAENILIKQN